ncbi:MAG: hypothetical protein WC866_03360 [Patescibacteria group bacterium]|jgi:hypothetical protein
MTVEVEKRREGAYAPWTIVAVIAYASMGLIGGFLMATICLLTVIAAVGLVVFAGYAMEGEHGLHVPKWEQARYERSRAEGAKHIQNLQKFGYLPKNLPVDAA